MIASVCLCCRCIVVLREKIDGLERCVGILTCPPLRWNTACYSLLYTTRTTKLRSSCVLGLTPVYVALLASPGGIGVNNGLPDLRSVTKRRYFLLSREVRYQKRKEVHEGISLSLEAKHIFIDRIDSSDLDV